MRQTLRIALEAARAGGEAIHNLYGRATLLGDKAGAGPVTEADLAANACIQAVLRREFPDDGWLSEESADHAERLSHTRLWVIDPLDGTREFITGVPEFVVSIGLAVEGVAVLGVLYNPITEEMFAGIRGDGAWLNGASIHVSAQTDLVPSTFCVSRTEMRAGLLRGLEGQFGMQPRGSIAYKCGLVAAGRSEGVFTYHPRHEWDICAGVAIIEAAGGRMTDRQGHTYRFNQADPLSQPVVGTNGHLHDALLAILTAQWPPQPGPF